MRSIAAELRAERARRPFRDLNTTALPAFCCGRAGRPPAASMHDFDPQRIERYALGPKSCISLPENTPLALATKPGSAVVIGSARRAEPSFAAAVAVDARGRKTKATESTRAGRSVVARVRCMAECTACVRFRRLLVLCPSRLMLRIRRHAGWGHRSHTSADFADDADSGKNQSPLLRVSPRNGLG